MTAYSIIIVVLFFIAFFLLTTAMSQRGIVRRIRRAEEDIAALRKRVLFIEDPEATETIFDWDYKI